MKFKELLVPDNFPAPKGWGLPLALNMLCGVFVLRHNDLITLLTETKPVTWVTCSDVLYLEIPTFSLVACACSCGLGFWETRRARRDAVAGTLVSVAA